MTPYLYAAVQCRDARAFQEVRTVGAVLLAPDARFGMLRHMPLERKLGEAERPFVAAILDAWSDEVSEIAKLNREAAAAWLRERAAGREDAVRLSEPAAGTAEDLRREVGRLVRELTGYVPGGGARPPAERAIADALRRHRLHRLFQPGRLSTGLVEWRFPYLYERHVLHPVTLAQRRPEGVLDAAFREVGRFDELRRAVGELDVLAVSLPAETPVVVRAIELYREHQIDVVLANADALGAALRARGFGDEPINK